MQDTKHYDILWVDDFDERGYVDDPRKELKAYFPSEFRFRVKVETNFFDALVHLENNFFSYSCVVLDVNFKNGFENGELNSEDEVLLNWQASLKNKKVRFSSDKILEFGAMPARGTKLIHKAMTLCRLCNILHDNNILIDQAIDTKGLFDDEIIDFEKIKNLLDTFERDDNEFTRNAGYYLFLYLLQRGMPQNNIAMLTGNKENTSREWSGKFEKASLNSPESFSKMPCRLTNGKKTSEFVDWLHGVFNPSYRLRACMVAMTSVLQKMLDDEGTKTKLVEYNSLWKKDAKNEDKDGVYRSSAVMSFHPEYIPFRLEENKSLEIFFHFVSQIITPWDKSTVHKCKEEDYPYYATMRTARNWLAHRVIQKLSLQTECFLFGICMRGMFNFSNLDSQAFQDYKSWEDELLKLIKKLDKDYPMCVDEFSSLIISSSKELCTYCSDKVHVHKVLSEIGQADNKIECYEEDLLRAFLHGVHGEIPPGYTPSGYSRYVGNLDEDIRGKYLEAIKNRLKKAIDETKKSSRNT